MQFPQREKAFTLIETLIVVAIIGILAVVVISALSSGTDRARDAKRKTDITQIGRFLATSCYVPNAGVGEYDIADLVSELSVKYSQYAKFISQIPQDPSTGTDTQSNYKYIVNNSRDCVIYANLENENESITLVNISSPTPGAGNGVLVSGTQGWNGSYNYFQISN